jgi:hypothetical protein
MAIIGNNTEIGVNDSSSDMYVQTGGNTRLTYNFTNGTMAQPNNIYAMITGGFGGDVTAGTNNYLDPSSINNSNGTFSFSSGRFTCPRTGAYRMTATTLNRTNWHHWAARNDVQVLTGAHNTGPSGYSSLHWSWIQFANAGDTLSFRGNQNSGTIWGGGWSMYSIAYIG